MDFIKEAYYEDILKDLFGNSYKMDKSYFSTQTSLITHIDNETESEVHTLMPNFRDSEYPFTSSTQAHEEFFIYSPSTNREFILRSSIEDHKGSIKLDLYQKNGEYLCSKIHLFRGEETGHQGNISVSFTNNGRYMCCIIDTGEPVKQKFPDEIRKVRGARTSDGENRFYKPTVSQTMKFYEITFVRRQSINKRIRELKTNEFF